MTTTQSIEAKAQQLLATRTIDQLVEQFQLTDTLMDDANEAERLLLATTRGWIMDELDRRGEAGEQAQKHLCGVTEW